MFPVLNGSRHERLQAEIPRRVLLRDTRYVIKLARMRDLRLGRQLHVLVSWLFLLLPLLPARQAQGNILRITCQPLDAVPHFPGRRIRIETEANHFAVI